MTSNSVLQAVKTAAYQIGGGLPLLVHSDSASSFIPLSRLEAPTDDEGGQESQNSQSVKTFNLRKVFQRHNIILKVSSLKASWRNSLAEAIVKQFKSTLKKSGLYQLLFYPHGNMWCPRYNSS